MGEPTKVEFYRSLTGRTPPLEKRAEGAAPQPQTATIPFTPFSNVAVCETRGRQGPTAFPEGEKGSPASASSATRTPSSTGVIKVLIIEDDPDVVDLLAMNFAKAGGFSVIAAADGATGLQKARDELPALIILDLQLPGLSGLEVCKRLKAQAQTKHIPITILTARADSIDRIVGLELGADDYVTKPFSPREVLLRVNAIIRRRDRDTTEERVTIGPIEIDPIKHIVAVSGKRIRLTMVEFKLLQHLMKRSGRVEPRERLLEKVWGYENGVQTRTIDTHVQRLRKKLGRAGDAIETIRGFGYRFRE